MKKLAIAGASLALAAMPVVSTFAAQTQYTSITDKVQLTVDKTCMMEASDSLTTTVTEPAASGTVVTLGAHAAPYEYAAGTGTPMTITCNAQAGWHLSASTTSLAPSATAAANAIPFGDYQTTTSVWSASVAFSGNNQSNAAIVSGWDGSTTNPWAPSTAGATVVNDVTDGNGKGKAVSGLVITPSYKAYVQADQAADTYTGTITFTFADDTPVQP